MTRKRKRGGRGPRTGKLYASRSPRRGGYMGPAASPVVTYIDPSIIVEDSSPDR